MGMKDLIRKILREDVNVSGLKKYITGIFETQVKRGEIPHIPFIDLERKKIYNNTNSEIIDQWYIEFVGGINKAKDNFFKSIETVTDKDVRELGFKIHPQDSYTIEIPWIDFDETTKLIIFGFVIKDCTLLTDNGLMTYQELLNDQDDQFWVDVTDWLRAEIEIYVAEKSKSFGLGVAAYNAESVWSD
jgi:hypothetical protein